MSIIKYLFSSSINDDATKNNQADVLQPEDNDAPGKWIWLPDSSDNLPNTYMYARKVFKLSAKPTSAIIKTTAETLYKLYVNGKYVGRGPVRSGKGYTYFDTYDIASLLNRGNNVIAFVVHHIGEITTSNLNKPAGLLCKANISTSKGSIIISTDETWKVTKPGCYMQGGARVSDGLGFQEIFDSSSRIDNWNAVRFNEKNWESSIVTGTIPNLPWGEIYEREIPELDETHAYPKAVLGVYNSPDREKDISITEIPHIISQMPLTPIKAGQIKDPESILYLEKQAHVKTPRGDRGVVAVLDFGRLVFGNVELGIGGSGSGNIDIAYGTELIENRVVADESGTLYADKVILKKGSFEWQSVQPRAFRYLQIEFRWCTKSVAIEHLRVCETLYPLKNKNTFECSDSILNSLWDTGCQSASICMEDTFIASPRYERLMNWAASRTLSKAALYAFSDTDLYAQSIKQLASAQKRDGTMFGVYPVDSDKPQLDLALLWTFSIMDYFAMTGDRDIISEMYPVFKRVLSTISSGIGKDGLISTFRGKLFINDGNIDERGENTIINCLYYHALRVGESLATIIENDEDAEKFSNTSLELRKNIHKYLFDIQSGLFADTRVSGKLIDSYSVNTNAIAVLTDIPDQYEKANIYRYLLNNKIDGSKSALLTSIILKSLFDAGKHADALRFIKKQVNDIENRGVDSIWENFDEYSGVYIASFPYLMSDILGVKPVFSSQRFSISPRAADLHWAKGCMQTVNGPLSIEWTVGKNNLSISLIVPEGITVDFYAPGEPGSRLELNGQAYTGRIMTLTGGEYSIRVLLPKYNKYPALDPSLKPTEIVKVEVLEAVSQLGRGGRRTKSSKHKDDSDLTTDISVDLDDEILDDSEHIETEENVISATEEKQKRKRRKRSRKGAKKHIPALDEAGNPVELIVEPNTSETTVLNEILLDVVPEVDENGEVVLTEVPKPAAKRRRRRSPRSRAKALAVEATDIVVEPGNELAEETPAVTGDALPLETVSDAISEVAEAAIEEKLSRPKRKRTRHRSRMPKPAVETQQENIPIDQPVILEMPVENEDISVVEEIAEGIAEGIPAKSKRKRTRHRSRTPKLTSETLQENIVIDQPVVVETIAESEPVLVTEEASEESSAKPKRKRARHRSRTPKQASETPQENIVISDEPVVFEVPVETQPVSIAEESAEDKTVKPKRKYVRRKKTPKPTEEKSE